MTAQFRAAIACAFTLACFASPAFAQNSNESAGDPGDDYVLPTLEIIQSAKPTGGQSRGRGTGYGGQGTGPVATPISTPVQSTTRSLTAASQPAGPSSRVGNLTAARAATSDTASLLDRLSGAATYTAGGISGLPVLNGFAADRLNIGIEGMGLIAACANQMNPPLSYIAPSQIGQIEVYSNVVPVSVGGDSVGGAILVSRPDPVFASAGEGLITAGEIGSYYRSNGDAFGGNASAMASVQDVSIRYDGSYAQSGNYEAGGPFKPAGPAFASNPMVEQSIPYLGADEVGSTAYAAQNHNIAVAARHENHLLEFDLGYQKIPYQNYPNQRMDMTDNEAIQGNIRYTGDYDWGVLEAQVYHQTVRHVMDFGDYKQFYYGGTMMSPQIAPGMPMKTKGHTTGGSITASYDVTERDVLRLGGEFQIFDYNDWWPPSPPGGTGMMAPNTFYNIRNGERDKYDVFAEWEREWTSQWTTQLGVRSDTVVMDTGPVQGYNAMYDAPPLFPATTFNNADRDRTDHNWDMTAQAIYDRSQSETYSFGYSRKTRSPNLYERYTWSNVAMAMEMNGWFGDGNYYIGNLDLDPETAHTLSFTADWHAPDRKTAIEVTPYYSYVQDFIDVRRCPTGVCGNSPAVVNSLTADQGFVYLQFVNQDAQLFGIDVSGHAVLAEDTRWGTFTARGLLSYVDGENIDTSDNLYHMMPVNGTIALEQKMGRWTNTIETVLVGAKTQVSQVRNEVETDAYALLNLRTSYEWNRFRIDVGMENVFDTFYELPLGGLYLGQGATMAGDGIPWGIALPGMGRSVYVAANMKF